jgi:hypothetical protein
MKKLMCFVVMFCFASAVMAEVVTIVPPQTTPGKIGALQEVYAYGVGIQLTSFSAVHTGSYPDTAIMTLGDYYGGFAATAGVIKFDLTSAGINSSTVISNAYLKGYGFSSSTDVYVKVQKYAGDNTTDLSLADLTAAMEEVGVFLAPKDDNFSYDITAAVAADIAAGKTYSSYFLTAVEDASGTMMDGIGTPEFYYSVIYDGWGSDQYYPRLDVTVIPEPATMALLALGGLLIRKKNA